MEKFCVVWTLTDKIASVHKNPALAHKASAGRVWSTYLARVAGNPKKGGYVERATGPQKNTEWQDFAYLQGEYVETTKGPVWVYEATIEAD